MSEFKFIYEDEPTRNKTTSAGYRINKHNKCGGRCVCIYAEAGIYRIHCENCGEVMEFETNNQDNAMIKWCLSQSEE